MGICHKIGCCLGVSSRRHIDQHDISPRVRRPMVILTSQSIATDCHQRALPLTVGRQFLPQNSSAFALSDLFCLPRLSPHCPDATSIAPSHPLFTRVKPHNTSFYVLPVQHRAGSVDTQKNRRNSPSARIIAIAFGISQFTERLPRRASNTK